LKVGQDIEVHTNTGKKFNATVRIDTDPELQYFKNGGILHYVLRKLMK
jgi:aconitate hydratase